MTGFAVELRGVPDDARRRAAGHLRDSASLMTSQLERLDQLFFRITAAEAKIVTPVTRAASAIAEAMAKPGPWLRASLPDLSRQDHYVLSEWLAASARRAWGRQWMDPATPAAEVVDQVQAAWDREFNVHGDPADRAHMRTAAAWKQPRRRRLPFEDRRPGVLTVEPEREASS